MGFLLIFYVYVFGVIESVNLLFLQGMLNPVSHL